MKKISPRVFVMILLSAGILIFILAYYLKDRMNIDIFPHRHLIFFRQ